MSFGITLGGVFLKIGIAGCMHETNTFAPGQTDLSHFKNEWVTDPSSFLDQYEGTRTGMGGVIDASRDMGFELEPLFYTQTTPSAIVAQDTAESILDIICKKIKDQASNLDGLVLILHGAMVSENWNDVEGEILSRVRDVFGSKPIAVTIDLHANVSQKMVDKADILIGYDTYPHIDAYERAYEASNLLVRQINKQIKPVTFLKTCNLLVPPISMRTDSQPMKDLLEQAFEFEKDRDVLDVSIVGGFPYADISIAGMTIIVTTDGNREKAQQIADQMYSSTIQSSQHFKPELHNLDAACSMADGIEDAPVIFVESSDNVGGGSPADATHVLKALTEKRYERFLIFISDPQGVKKALSIGENKKMVHDVGGKTDQRYGYPVIHGEPVRIEGEVRLLSDGEYMNEGKYMTGKKFSMGKTAVIEINNCPGSKVVLTENRVSPRDPQQLKILQINPEDYQIIVVKAAIAWRTMFKFEPRHIIEVDTPGCCSSNLSHFKFKNIPQEVEIIS